MLHFRIKKYFEAVKYLNCKMFKIQVEYIKNDYYVTAIILTHHGSLILGASALDQVFCCLQNKKISRNSEKRESLIEVGVIAN
jgi:hypothetical protein